MIVDFGGIVWAVFCMMMVVEVALDLGWRPKRHRGERERSLECDFAKYRIHESTCRNTGKYSVVEFMRIRLYAPF